MKMSLGGRRPTQGSLRGYAPSINIVPKAPKKHRLRRAEIPFRAAGGLNGCTFAEIESGGESGEVGGVLYVDAYLRVAYLRLAKQPSISASQFGASGRMQQSVPNKRIINV